MVVARVRGVKVGQACACCPGPCDVCGCTPQYATVTIDPPIPLPIYGTDVGFGPGTDCAAASFGGAKTLTIPTGTFPSLLFRDFTDAQGHPFSDTPSERYTTSLACGSGHKYTLLVDFVAICDYPSLVGSPPEARGVVYRLYRRTAFGSTSFTGADNAPVFVDVTAAACSGGVGTYALPDTDLWLAANRVDTGFPPTPSRWYAAVPAGAITVAFHCNAYAASPMMAAFAAPPAPDAPDAPTARHAVVTLAVGQKGRDLLAVSGPLMAAAAARWGADFRVVGGDDTAFNIGEKLRIGPTVAAYERTLYLDADALILPTCPNPFETFPAGSVYAHDDLRWLQALGHPTEWIDAETAAVCESQGWTHGGPFREYWNSGVWLLDRGHAPAFDPPAAPYPVWHCSEQHAVNHRMRAAGYPVVEFGRKWNWQRWVDMGLANTAGVHLMHFSGMDPHGGDAAGADARHADRLALMRRFAAPPPPRGRCGSLGDLTPGATAARLGLSTLRQWHPCAKGRGTAGHVCQCDSAATCAGCPDWTPAAD